MRRLAMALFALIFVLAAFVPSGARAATGAALPAQANHVAQVTAPASSCATEELKCRLRNLVCAVVDCNPTGVQVRTAAPSMTCSFPDDPTGEFCKVVMTVVGVVCRNHCLAAGDSPAMATTHTRAAHFSRLYAIN
jgi:hypothetical protein